MPLIGLMAADFATLPPLGEFRGETLFSFLKGAAFLDATTFGDCCTGCATGGGEVAFLRLVANYKCILSA